MEDGLINKLCLGLNNRGVNMSSFNIFTLPQVRLKKSDYKTKKNRSQGAPNLSKLADHVSVTHNIVLFTSCLYVAQFVHVFKKRQGRKS